MNTTVNGTALLIEFPENLDTSFAENIQKDATDWIESKSETFAFDFKKTIECKQSTYRALVMAIQQLRKAKKTVVSFNVVDELAQQFKVAGISSTLNIAANIDDYLKKPQSKKVELDVQLINPFLEATQFTLEQQASTKCEAQKPQLISLDEKLRSDDIAIAGVITLNSEQFTGTITLAFPEIVFLKIYESMCGEKVEKITPEIEDAAGELLNIIYGSAKTKLNELTQYKFTPALPTILSGEKIKIRQTTSQKIIILPFKTDFGFFRVEISFDTT